MSRELRVNTAMDPETIYRLDATDSPAVAAAIHDGHAVRDELRPFLAVADADRLREEDPFTAELAQICDSRIIGLRSRFEVDLNRPREKAVYLRPEDAWGLIVYDPIPPPEIIDRSLAEYDNFYRALREFIDDLAARYERFVILDLHSYNHRRGGPDAQPAEPDDNPEVNIGTGTMPDRDRFAGLIDRFARDLQSFDMQGRCLDVRENVKFKGGQFPRWIHANYPGSACVLSVEFKKTFMDEWTGRCDRSQLALLHNALASTVPGLLETLE